MHTVLRHWVHGGARLETFPARCLTYAEAMAEKLRAALSRQEVAIRDFFDIDHGVRVAGLDVTGAELVRLLRAKLAVPGTGGVNVSPERLDDLTGLPVDWHDEADETRRQRAQVIDFRNGMGPDGKANNAPSPCVS